jgi:hypothetical protein
VAADLDIGCAAAHTRWKAARERALALPPSPAVLDLVVRIVIPGLMLLAACGDGATAADAALPDGNGAVATDAAIDAATDTIAVTVTAVGDDGQPEASTVILVHGGDGTLLGQYRTDAAGHAAVEAPIGGMVSAVQYGSGRAVTTTVLGVQALDELHFQAPPRRPAPTTQLEVFAPPGSGATSFHAFSSCSLGDTGGDLLQISVPTACLDGLAQFVVVARGPDGQQSQVSAVIEDAGPAIGFTGPYRPLPSMVLDVRGQGALSVGPVVPAGHEALLPVLTPLEPGLVTVPLAGTGSGLTLRATSGDGSIAQRFATTPAGPVPMDLDAIPYVGPLRLVYETRAFTWGAGGGATVDGLVLQVVAERGTETTWRFVMPSAERGLTLPALPDELAHLSPFAGVDGAVRAQLTRVDLSWVSGWDTFRQRGHDDAAQLPAIVATRLEDSRALVGRSSELIVEE